MLENILAFHIAHDPAPCLAVFPTLQLAQAFSKDRLSPMVRNTPALSGKLETDQTKNGTNTILHKVFPGGQLTLSGSNSPASLASRPIRILLCDELSRWAESAGTEGNPFLLAQKRTTAFHNRKIICASTPGNDGACLISFEWERSDKRKYFVPCPECGHMQALHWESVKWELFEGGSPDLKSVHYECESCHEKITEKHKTKMLKLGKWIAELPTKKVAGFYVNELYSPWRTWAEILDDYWKAKDHPERLKVWVNTSMGLPFKYSSQEQPEWRTLYNKRKPFSLSAIPSEIRLLTAGVDVQKDRIEISIIGWNKHESWVLDHSVLAGNTFDTDDNCWQQLEQLLSTEFKTVEGRFLKIKKLAIDAGYNTTSVYRWVLRQSRHLVMAIKGQNLDTVLSQPKKASLNERGKPNKMGPLLWRVGSNVIKADLYGRFTLQEPTDKEIEKNGFASNYVHFSELSESYFQQLCGEACVLTVDKSGKAKYDWKQMHPNVEALDCFVYATAAFTALGADRWTQERWDSIL